MGTQAPARRGAPAPFTTRNLRTRKWAAGPCSEGRPRRTDRLADGSRAVWSMSDGPGGYYEVGAVGAVDP